MSHTWGGKLTEVLERPEAAFAVPEGTHEADRGLALHGEDLMPGGKRARRNFARVGTCDGRALHAAIFPVWYSLSSRRSHLRRGKLGAPVCVLAVSSLFARALAPIARMCFHGPGLRHNLWRESRER